MKSIMLSLFLGILFVANGQTSFQEIIVAEGGSFGAPGNQVKFGSYQAHTGNFHHFDSITGDFTNQVFTVQDEGYFHVGRMLGNDLLLRYDLRCKTSGDSAVITGFQRAAVYNNKVIVSRGFGADSNFVWILDRTDLSLQQELPVTDFCHGISVQGDMAYIAQNGAWPSYTDTGTVVVIDLATNQIDSYIKLDTICNPVKKVYAKDSLLYCISDGLAGATTLAVYNLNTGLHQNYLTNEIVESFGIFNDNVFLAQFTGVHTFNTASNTYVPSALYSGFSDDGTMDTTNNELYFHYTDWGIQQGYLTRTDEFGASIDTINTGIAGRVAAVYDDVVVPGVNDTSFVITNDSMVVVNTMSNAEINLCFKYKLVDGPAVAGAQAYAPDSASFVYKPLIGLVTVDTFRYAKCNSYYQCDTAMVIVTVYPANGLSDNSNPAFAIVPNPTQGNFVIKGEVGHTCKVYNLFGQLVHETILTEGNKVDVSELSNGSYWVEIDGQYGKQVQQLIVNR